MVPGGDRLPWLRRMFQKSGGLVPGEAPRALTLDARPDAPALRLAVLNCYEDTLTEVGRRMTQALEPNLLVNITNDAWFYDTAESELHARLAAMRAIESRRDLVRAVNLGVMTWVDATGAVRARYDQKAAGTLVVTPAIIDGPPTVYGRLGDAPLWAVLAGSAALFYAQRRRGEA
jgi:apolipoprotein N-acyltransferase